MEPALLAIASWLDAIGISDWARASPSVYPVANVIHLLGLVMLVGGIGILDLRMAGLWRAIPIAALERALTPVAVAGLLTLAASGTLLFAADGRALAGSGVFQLKLVLIAAALMNVALFRFWRRRREFATEAPLSLRLMAATSLMLWLGVGTAGRMIAYS